MPMNNSQIKNGITPKKEEKAFDRRSYLRRHMMEYGLQGMPTVDVVELILYYTIPRKDVRFIAQEMVSRFGTINRMVRASSRERKSVPGIGDRTDEHFAMMGMFIPHVLRSRMGDFPVLDTFDKLEDFCTSLHVMEEYETLYVLCLNAKNKLIKKEVKITTGTPRYINVELKHIMDAVANSSTVKVVLCHNHPSGDLKPSVSDIEFTRSVKNSLSHINITLYDHIVVADNSAVSMKQLRLL